MYGTYKTLTSPIWYLTHQLHVPILHTTPNLLILLVVVAIMVWLLFGMLKNIHHLQPLCPQLSWVTPIQLLICHGYLWNLVLNLLLHQLMVEYFGGILDNLLKDLLNLSNLPNKLMDKIELLVVALLNSMLKLVLTNFWSVQNPVLLSLLIKNLKNLLKSFKDMVLNKEDIWDLFMLWIDLFQINVIYYPLLIGLPKSGLKNWNLLLLEQDIMELIYPTVAFHPQDLVFSS